MANPKILVEIGTLGVGRAKQEIRGVTKEVEGLVQAEAALSASRVRADFLRRTRVTKQLRSELGRLREEATKLGRGGAVGTASASFAAFEKRMKSFKRVGVEELKEEMLRLNAVFGRTSRDLGLAGKATEQFSRKGSRFFGLFRRATQDFGEETEKTKKKTKRFAETVDAFARSVRIAEGPLGGTAARLQTFAALTRSGNFALVAFVVTFAVLAAVVAVGTRALFKFTLTLERLEKRLTVASGSLSGAQLTLEKISKISQDVGADLTSSAIGFAKLAAAARGTNLEGQDTLDLFEGVADAAAALSLSVDDTSRAFRALEQIISKGTVQAEELRGQLGEAIPGAFQLAAAAMQVTTEKLGEMLKQGRVISDDFIPRFAKKLKEVFGDLAKRQAESLQGRINSLRNSFFKLGSSLVILLDLKIVFGDLVGLMEKLVILSNKLASPGQSGRRTLEFAKSAVGGAKIALEIAKPEGNRIDAGRFNQLQEVIRVAEDRVRSAQKALDIERDELLRRSTGSSIQGDNQFSIDMQNLLNENFEESIRLSSELGQAFKDLNIASNKLLNLKVISRGTSFFSAPQIDDVEESIREMNATIGKTTGQFGRMEDELVDFLVGINRLGPAVAQFRDNLGGLDPVLQKANEAFRNARRVADLSDIFDDNTTALEVYEAGLIRLAGADAFARQTQSGDKLAETLVVLKREQDRLITVFGDTDPVLSRLSDGFDALADGIVEAMTTAGSAMEGFRNVARQIVNDILADFLKLAIITPLKNALFGAFGNFLSGAISGGSVNPLAAGGGGGTLGLSSIVPSTPLTQFGGQFRVGGSGGTDSQLVALRATPGEDITVTNRNRSRSGPGGGGGDTIFIDARGADQGQIKRLQDQLFALNASVETRVLNTVADRNRRTSKFIRR